jgi:hypothetical protein
MKKKKDFNVVWHGYNVKCSPVGRQEYSNCYIESGTVIGHPTDTIYLKVCNDDMPEPSILLLRPDEAEAIIWVLSGVLWNQEMEKI